MLLELLAGNRMWLAYMAVAQMAAVVLSLPLTLYSFTACWFAAAADDATAAAIKSDVLAAAVAC